MRHQVFHRGHCAAAGLLARFGKIEAAGWLRDPWMKSMEGNW
ncbi:hypothetical protein EKH55_5365 [Sinorhizobium alkalisoli]|nr:hypothetical protein EKH55_5365 [Sinorhizobium alkalisoli]